MSRMSLETAIRLSAEVKGGGNITKVQREIQSLAASSKLSARELGTMRVAALQLARANDGTVAGIRSSIAALRGLKDQAKIGGQEFRTLGADIQKLEAKLRGVDGTAEKAGRSMGQNLAAGLAAGLAAAGIGQAVRGSLEAVVADEESQRRLRSLSQGLDDYSKVQSTATAAAQKFGVAQTQANQEFAQIYARLRPIGLTLEEISSVYNGFNTAAKLSGTTSAEASAAFLQLSQALGTGVLRGEELNSVFEQTPAVVQGIAQVMGVPIGQIRELAKEGKISGDIVLEALRRIERDGAPKLAEAMKGPAQQFKNLQIAGQDLQIQIGQALLPTALALANAALALAQGFNSLPGPVKNTAIAVGIATTAILGLVAAAAALKAGLAALGITGVVTALKGLTLAAVAAKVQMLALNTVALLNPWVTLAAGIGAATYALATYRSESEKIGGKAATGDAGGLAAAQQRITAKQQEISALEGQRPGPRSSRGGDLARARVELAQLQRDVQTGRRAAGGGVVPAAPVLPGNAMNTPIGATVGGGGGGDKPKKQSAAGLEAEGIKAQADAAEKMREQLKAADSINVALKDRLALAQTTEPVARQMLEYDIKQNELTREYEQLKSAAAGPDELILLNANLIIEQRIEQIEHEEKLNSLLAERAVLMANVAAQAAMPTVYNELETQEAALQAVLDKYPAIGAAADAASTLATSGVSEMIAGTKDAKEVFVDFLSSIADALMNTAKQMIAQYIAIGIARMFAGMGGSVATDAGGWATSFATPQAGIGTGFNFDAGAMTGGTPWSFAGGGLSFAGGGYTGNAPRAGGVDGQGGFPAILHPRETVIDHTRAISRQGAATPASAPVSVTVNVDASGNSQVSGDQNKGAQLGRAIANAVEQELVRHKRQGGLLWPS
jgi:tape measure domain-containing protein